MSTPRTGVMFLTAYTHNFYKFSPLHRCGSLHSDPQRSIDTSFRIRLRGFMGSHNALHTKLHRCNASLGRDSTEVTAESVKHTTCSTGAAPTHNTRLRYRSHSERRIITPSSPPGHQAIARWTALTHHFHDITYGRPLDVLSTRSVLR